MRSARRQQKAGERKESRGISGNMSYREGEGTRSAGRSLRLELSTLSASSDIWRTGRLSRVERRER
jgi:hypothetical protein